MPDFSYPERVVNVNVIISDVTGARAVGNIYQNTTNRPRFIIVTATCIVSLAGATSYIEAFAESVTPPTISQGSSGIFLSHAAESLRNQLVFLIPAGYYYQVSSTLGGAGSSVTLHKWIEVQL